MEHSTPNADMSQRPSPGLTGPYYSDTGGTGEAHSLSAGSGARHLRPEARCFVLLGTAPRRLRIDNERRPYQCLRSVRLQLGSHYYKLNTNGLEATEGQNHCR